MGRLENEVYFVLSHIRDSGTEEGNKDVRLPVCKAKALSVFRLSRKTPSPELWELTLTAAARDHSSA